MGGSSRSHRSANAFPEPADLPAGHRDPQAFAALTRAAGVFLAAVFAAAAGTAPVPAATRHGCQLKGSKIVVKSSQAVVLKRLRDARLYGCYFRKGAIYRLEQRSDFGADILRPIVLSGRYVAYVQVFEGPAAYDQGEVRMTVRNLVNGVIGRSANLAPEWTTDLRSVRLKPNGSVAWIARDNEFHVRVLDSLSKRDATGISWRWIAREVDHGQQVDPRSLRLTADRRSVRWTNGGVAKSAAIR